MSNNSRNLKEIEEDNKIMEEVNSTPYEEKCKEKNVDDYGLKIICNRKKGHKGEHCFVGYWYHKKKIIKRWNR